MRWSFNSEIIIGTLNKQIEECIATNPAMNLFVTILLEFDDPAFIFHRYSGFLEFCLHHQTTENV